MPEGDTVYRQCRILDDALAGGTVTQSDLRVPQAATTDLRGWRIAGVQPRGKHLLMRFLPPAGVRAPAMTLHSHLMMDGIWQVNGRPLRSSDTNPGPRPAHTARILLTVQHDDGHQSRAVGFAVQQVRLLPTAREQELIAHLGPDLLDPLWGTAHREEAIRRLAAIPSRPLGLALLDQQNLAGIGNIYRSELCFLEGVHPGAPVAKITDLGTVVDRARRLLWLNRDRPVRVTTGGMLGRDGDLWVYGRTRRPCRRCRRPIVRELLAEPRVLSAETRPIFVCPRCQGATAP